MYADYDFYLNAYYGDAIAAEDFPRLSERASDYVRAATRGLSDTVDGSQLEAVKKASCAVAEVLLDESVMTAAVYSGEQAVSSEAVGDGPGVSGERPSPPPRRRTTMTGSGTRCCCTWGIFRPSRRCSE